MAKSISEYQRKRNFELTSEPSGRTTTKPKRRGKQALRFVIQKHDARRLHYDFRLELDGALKSWAVPKGPSLDPQEKRLAVEVEDHPLDYAGFEGSIPQGQYGAGDVIVWDQGVWQPDNNPTAAYKAGKLKFTLIGEKLSGAWTLVRTQSRGSSAKTQWLLIKERDQSAARKSADYDVVNEQPQSVLTGALVGGVTSAVVNAGIPDRLSPELATLVNEPPDGDWLYEIKFDGYRIMARISDGEVRLFTRNGHDWSARMPEQVAALQQLPLKDTWLDGEVVVLNEQGLPSFQALQNAFDTERTHQLVYYIFDAPFLNGKDLRNQPIEQRRAVLEKILTKNPQPVLRFSAAFDAHYKDIVNSACAMALEGVIGKRIGSPYVSRRSDDWIKLKCRLRQEFVIIGYTAPQGSRSGFGALLLGLHADVGDKRLVYAGRVGTGFSSNSLTRLHQQLRKLERSSTPLVNALRGAQARGVQWVQPVLVCEVEFAEWTAEGVLRQAAFIALRSDKPAADIVREQPRLSNASLPLDNSPMPAATKVKNAATDKRSVNNRVAGITITNATRIIDADSGAQKIDLARFYAAIADWVLPQLDRRPVSLVRAPEGVGGEQFFQKHAERLSIPHMTHLDPALDPGHARLMEITSTKALVGAVQMGTIELHTWGATHDNIEAPDRIILDLDPDPALPWRSMIEATRLTLAVLDELKLAAYLKTSGGKGIHIIVPLARHTSWDQVKAFAKAISEFMAHQIPERFVAKMGPKNRIGKIFIDYLRNSRGASTVTAYSVRARPSLPVSVPITRAELLKLTSAAQWNIANLPARLDAQTENPWEGYNNRQRITAAMWKRLGTKAL
jgi:bifunctional non-homologous end joining protein LigD